MASSDQLIDKFATLIEEGEALGSSEFADKAVEIIAMISVAPDVSDTLQKINAKLYSLLRNRQEVEFDALAKGMSSKACAANEIRALKKSCDVLH